MKILSVEHNNISELDLTNNEVLHRLYANNNQINNIIFSSSPQLSYLYVSDNKLTNLNLTSFITLNYLKCQNNQLTNLDLNATSSIKTLDCTNNQLTELDLSTFPRLQFILCANNQLTHLQLTENPVDLENLDCSNNLLSELTVFPNSDSRYFLTLKCSGNIFTELDISHSKVTVLDCGDNPLLEAINWRNGWNYHFNPNNSNNGFQNLPNLNSVCIDTYYPELIDFILTEVGHSVEFYNNETCDALSVNDNNLNALSITPNPAERYIEIKASSPINQIIIYNELGQLVSSKTLNEGINGTTLDISGLNQGIYFVKIAHESGSSIMKKVIKN